VPTYYAAVRLTLSRWTDWYSCPGKLSRPFRILYAFSCSS